MKFNLPTDVKHIINTLESNGYEAYLVGGAVRSLIMKQTPHDWDICTSAKPEEIKRCFSKTIDTGIKHGTVTVIADEGQYEVTTFRIDGDYSDNRRPDSVTFTTSLKKDLSRRDFTINAMAYNEQTGLVDPFHGVADIHRKQIRAVGSPDERFQEDALRMMRAIRFGSQLCFHIESQTRLSIIKNSRLISKISTERVRDELVKILVSDNPNYILELTLTGLMQYIVPEVDKMLGFDQCNKNHDKDVYGHTIAVLQNTPPILCVRLGALFHDIGKPKTFSHGEDGTGHFYDHHIVGAEMTKEILTRLKFDNKTIDTVTLLVREHMSRYDFIRKATVKRFINRVGVENLDYLFELQRADISGSKPPHDYSQLKSFKKQVDKILTEKQPLTVKDLAVDGYDLMNLGIKPGVKMGKILDCLLSAVLENPQVNTREYLLGLAKAIHKKISVEG